MDGAMTAAGALEDLVALRGRGFSGPVRVTGDAPWAPTRFRVAQVVAAVQAATAGIVGDLLAGRDGRVRAAECDARGAIAALAAVHFAQVADGQGGWTAPAPDPETAVSRALTRPWPTRDGRHVLPHFSLLGLQARMVAELGCDLTPASVAAAVAARDAAELEEAFAAARVCGGMVRSEAEWRAHPHGALLAARPVISIDRIGDAPVEPVPGGARALSGLRVLDLTRILAGPVAARTLAEYGADVLMVAADGTPQIPAFVRETSHGKRSTFLDLDRPDDAARLRDLVRGADVFSQGYRPGVLEARGLGPEALAELRPGIVALSISCYGHGGSLSDRAGWEQVAQSVTGICAEQGAPGAPELIPLPACDYLTGYLGALGALMALERRAEEGGSWHVQVSLCRSAMFLQDHGRHAAPGRFPTAEEVTDYMVESDGARGPMRFVGPIARLEGEALRYERQSPVLGADRAAWL